MPLRKIPSSGATLQDRAVQHHQVPAGKSAVPRFHICTHRLRILCFHDALFDYRINTSPACFRTGPENRLKWRLSPAVCHWWLPKESLGQAKLPLRQQIVYHAARPGTNSISHVSLCSSRSDLTTTIFLTRSQPASASITYCNMGRPATSIKASLVAELTSRRALIGLTSQYHGVH